MTNVRQAVTPEVVGESDLFDEGPQLWRNMRIEIN